MEQWPANLLVGRRSRLARRSRDYDGRSLFRLHGGGGLELRWRHRVIGGQAAVPDSAGGLLACRKQAKSDKEAACRPKTAGGPFITLAEIDLECLLLSKVTCDRGSAVAVASGNDFAVRLNEHRVSKGFATAECRPDKAAVTERRVYLPVG